MINESGNAIAIDYMFAVHQSKKISSRIVCINVVSLEWVRRRAG